MNKYNLNYLHCILYLIIFGITIYLQLHNNTIPNSILVSIVFGWNLYAFVTIGHDAMHQTFSHNNYINSVVAFCCLDMIVMPSSVWQQEHQFHHQFPGQHEDNMILEPKSNMIKETFKLLTNKHNGKLYEQLYKIPLFILILSVFQWYYVPIIWFSFLSSFSFFALTPHIIEQNIRLLSSKQRQEAHVVACNIFPQSMIYTFLAGALNIHAMHHLNPRLTRQQLMQQYVEHPEQMNIMTLKGYYQLIKHL